jgi:hypothetical protein
MEDSLWAGNAGQGDAGDRHCENECQQNCPYTFAREAPAAARYLQLRDPLLLLFDDLQ